MTDAAWRPAARELIGLLEARGLVALEMGAGVVLVLHPAEVWDADDSVPRVISPGLRQEVQCCRRTEGELWWFWIWRGGDYEVPPELEPLCPVSEAGTAANRLVKVLAVPGADESGGIL